MKIQYLDREHVLSMLPERTVTAHKGSVGKVLLLCGSRGYTGAAALAAMGALRCGAGLVFLGVPQSIYVIEAIKLLEPVVFPLPDADGMFSSDAVCQLENCLPNKDAVLIGPGIGRSADVFAVVKYVMENFDGPIVLDADGINVLSTHKDIIANRLAPTILTPHKGEFERLGICVDDTDAGRISSARTLALELGAIIVLKGHRTVITDGTSCIVNTTGNPGMAVGGCGDVLSGMITALLAQGLDPVAAAACGAWVHGRAGDHCAQKLGQYGMLPSDMLEVIPLYLK